MFCPERRRKSAGYPPLLLGRQRRIGRRTRGAEELLLPHLLRCYPNSRPLCCRHRTPLYYHESGRRRRRNKHRLPPSPPSPPSRPTFMLLVLLLLLLYRPSRNHTARLAVGLHERLPHQLRILLDKNVKERTPRLLLAPLPRGLRRVGSSLVLGPILFSTPALRRDINDTIVLGLRETSKEINNLHCC